MENCFCQFTCSQSYYYPSISPEGYIPGDRRRSIQYQSVDLEITVIVGDISRVRVSRSNLKLPRVAIDLSFQRFGYAVIRS